MPVTIGVVDDHYGFPILVRELAGGSPDMLIRWWRDHAAWIEERLHNEGAILFRGFGVSDPAALREVVMASGAGSVDYRDGNSPRTALGEGVYTSTEYPPEFAISLHNELSYSARWPDRLWFCCVTPAEQGGETPLADCRAILQALPAPIVGAFRRSGVRYIRNLHDGAGYGPSWQQTFATTDRSAVDRFLESGGVSPQWRGTTLRVSSVRPATARHPVTGEDVWFNQADQFHPSTHPPRIREALLKAYRTRPDELPQNAEFGDGTAIPDEWLDEIRRTIRQHTVAFPWQSGDLVLVDNMLVCHGRNPFTGPRRVLAMMTNTAATAAHAAAGSGQTNAAP